MKIERKSDQFKVLESDSITLSRYHGYRCENCKERYQLQPKYGDNRYLFCLNCGHETAIRKIKHDRGLVAPAIQNQIAAIVQSSKAEQQRGKDRKPKGINTDKKSMLEQSLQDKGFEIIDSNTIEPR